MDMHVTVCPSENIKDNKGNFVFNEVLYFRRFEDADAWLQKQPPDMAGVVYTVPCFHKGLYAIRNNTMMWWSADLIEQAEDYADKHDIKLIEFNRSWLE